MKKFLFIITTVFFFQHAGNVFARTFERRQLMFGDVEVIIAVEADLPKKIATKKISDAFQIMRDLEKVFSTYIADSTINQFNKKILRPGIYTIPNELLEALQFGESLRKITRGGFEPTFGMKTPCPGCYRIVGKKIHVDKPVQINLTGFAKGFIVDAAFDYLKNEPKITGVFVAASGDVRVKNRKPQKLGIRDPQGDQSQISESVLVADGALSTSGLYERGQHIRNTVGNSNPNLQVSVLAKSATWSDGLDNALFYQTIPMIKKIVDELQDVKVYVITREGEKRWFGKK